MGEGKKIIFRAISSILAGVIIVTSINLRTFASDYEVNSLEDIALDSETVILESDEDGGVTSNQIDEEISFGKIGFEEINFEETNFEVTSFEGTNESDDELLISEVKVDLYSADSEQAAKESTLASGDQLIIDDGKEITVNGNLKITGGSIRIANGTLNVQGDVILEAGSISVETGKLNVKGNLNVGEAGKIDESYGYRYATSRGYVNLSKDGEINVLGKMTFCTTEKSNFSGGTVNLYGDLYVYGSCPKVSCGNYAYSEAICTTPVSGESPCTWNFLGEKANKIYVEKPNYFYGKIGNDKINVELLSDIPGFTVYKDTEVTLAGDSKQIGIGNIDSASKIDLNGHKVKIKNRINLTKGGILVGEGSLEICGDLNLGEMGEFRGSIGYRCATSRGYVKLSTNGKIIIRGNLTLCTTEKSEFGGGTVNLYGDLYHYGTDPSESSRTYASALAINTEPDSENAPCTWNFLGDKAKKIYIEGKNDFYGKIGNDKINVELLSDIPGFTVYKDMEVTLAGDSKQVGIVSYNSSPEIVLNGHKVKVNHSLELKKGGIAVDSGTLEICGDLNLGKKGEIDASTGYRYATSEGYLTLSTGGKINILGNLTLCTNHWSRISGGTVNLYGDLYDYGTYSNTGRAYAYSGAIYTNSTYNWNFLGDKANKIYVEKPTFFNGIIGNDKINVELLSDIPGFKVYKDMEVTLAGNSKQVGIIAGGRDAIDLNGHKVKVNHSLELKKGEITVGSGNLKICGDLCLGEKGEIDKSTGYRYATSEGKIILSDAGELDIDGDFSICSSNTSDLHHGIVKLKGSFHQYGNASSSGYAIYNNIIPHYSTLILCGNNIQRVDAESSYVRFDTIQINQNPENCKSIEKSLYTQLIVKEGAGKQLSTPIIKSATVVAGGVQLKWDAVEGAEKYHVYKKAGSSWTRIGATTENSFVATGLTAGTTYTFTVRCFTSDGKTYTSDYDKTGKTVKYMLSTPVLLSAENVDGGALVKWKAVSGAAKYRVYKKTEGGSWARVGDTTGTSFKVTGLTAGTKYSFTVRCFTSDGKTITSDYDKNGKSIKYMLATPVLTSAKKVSGGAQISWNAVNGAAKYRVYKKVAGGNWVRVADTTGTSYKVTGLSEGTTYTFTVRCFTSDGKTFTSDYDKNGLSVKY